MFGGGSAARGLAEVKADNASAAARRIREAERMGWPEPAPAGATGKAGLISLGNGSGSSMCLNMTAIGVSAVYGTRPVAISYRTMPAE